MAIRINHRSAPTGENRSGPAIVRRHRARVLGPLALLALALLASGLMAAPAHAQVGPDLGSTLTAGGTINPGQYLQSPNGQYTLQMQSTDGNLVEYGPAGPLWDPPPPTPTAGHQGAYAVLQGDGNFVVYAADHRTPLWASYTNVPGGGDVLTLQNDGNLVIYTADWKTALWATMSGAVYHHGQPGTTNSTYPAGQCTWYADQEAHLYTGVWLPNQLRNAGQWAANAARSGWATGTMPRIGSVIVFMNGADGADPTTGHVAWVTAYYPNTGKVVISEMNYPTGAGQRTRTIPDGVNNPNYIQYIYMNP
jgi:surface antigen